MRAVIPGTQTSSRHSSFHHTTSMVQAVTRADLLGPFALMRERGKSENTIHRVWTPLRGLLDYAVGEGYIVQNPVSRLKRQEVARSSRAPPSKVGCPPSEDRESG